MAKRIIIVGGVAGGASVATRLRRLDETAEIIIYEAGPYISFANCGLPYYVGGTIQQRENLLVKSVQAMAADFNITAHVNCRVTAIDPQKKTLQIDAKDQAQPLTDHYDQLVLATGVRPIRPNLPGLDEADNVFTVRTVPDVDQITAYMAEHGTTNKRAIVVGGGFVGLEMVENLNQKGYHVTLVEAQSQVMTNFDPEMAQYLHEHLQDNGVQLMLNTKLAGFENNGHRVLLDSGKGIPAELVILAMGVRPNNALAQSAGLKTSDKGFIRVDDRFQTNVPDIYALGDVISVVQKATGEIRSIPLAGPANRQGRFLADILAGQPKRNPVVLGTSVLKAFDLTAAATGANEQQLKAAHLPYQAIHLHPAAHATYYPDATRIELKVLFGADDGRLLGAQAIGAQGVDKRIDMIATAMNFSATITDLIDIEVAYAPPYASAKDPVNFAGYIGEDILNGLVKTIQWSQVDQLVADQAVFLDVRNPIELMAMPKIPGALNIPRSAIRQRLSELPKDQPIYVYCSVGLRGYNVCRILSQLGYDVYNLDGGLSTYRMGQYQSDIGNGCFNKD